MVTTTNIIQNIIYLVNKNKGSSFVSPAYGRSGTRATIKYNSQPAEKNRAKPEKQKDKKEGGLGEGIFARLLCPPKAGWGWESVSAIPLVRGRQNRKIFFSLIEKNLGARD